MISFEGFSQMLLNFLRVPPGTALRPANGSNKYDDFSQIIENSEYIQSVVDITKDDVCLGKSPLYYECAQNADKSVLEVVENIILPAYNRIVTWACRDLLTKGYSVYRERKVASNYCLIPVLDEVSFYLDNKMEIAAFIGDDKLSLKNALIFVNYDKTSMSAIDDSDNKSGLLFKVSPMPIQLKYVGKTAAELTSQERSILRYRQQLSRILRFINVDIGIAQGKNQQEVIDSISSAINADPDTLDNMSTFTLYNDQIPIIPNRRGVGKPEYSEHIPSANISDLADLDHTMKKLNLQLRFPKTYADFDNALGETAASTIRGDIRYNRLLSQVRTAIEDPINQKLQETEELKKAKVVFKLEEMPTPENADVIDTLQQFGGFVDDSWSSIINESESKKEAMNKSLALQSLLGGSANLEYLKKFFDVLNTAISDKFGEDEDIGGYGPDNLGSEEPEPFTEDSNDNSSEVQEPESSGGSSEYTNEAETFEEAPNS